MNKFEIIPGSVFGTYKAVAVSIGKASKQNRDGIVANFMVRTLKPYDKVNRITKAGNPVNDILWEEDDPELYNTLNKYKNPTPIPQGQPNAGSFVVPLSVLQKIVSDGDRLLKKQIAFEEEGGPELTEDEQTTLFERGLIKPLLMVDGGTIETYVFQKGPCYANDANNNRTTDAQGNSVVRSQIDIFCVIDHATENADGSLNYSWANGMSPSAKGSRIEQRFWRTPANTGATTIPLPPAQPAPETAPAPATNPQNPGEAIPY